MFNNDAQLMAVIGVILSIMFSCAIVSAEDGSTASEHTIMTTPELLTQRQVNSVFQYAISNPDYKAFLWIPPNCSHVRGLVVDKWNYFDETLIEDPQIRKACEDENLGLVCLLATTPEMHQTISFFEPKERAAEALLQTLADLAEESGYQEIASVPLFTIGHSYSGGFAWRCAAWDRNRVFGALAIKTGCWDTKNPGDNMEGVPVLNLVGQYSEWGSGEGYGEPFGDAVEALAMRRNPKHLTAFAVEWGGGHFEWSENCARLASLFIRKAAKVRLPDQPALEGPVKLKEIDPSSGWLMLPYFYPGAVMRPSPAKEFPQDKRAAYWYIDEEFANACRDFTDEQRNRKIQKLCFMRDGKPVGYADQIKDKTGLQQWGELVPEADGITYRFNAGFMDTMPARFPKAGEPLGHAPGPVHITCDVGPFEPVEDGAFRLKFSRISYLNPVVGFHASHPGDKDYAASVAPMQAAAPKKNTQGKPQRIIFAEIPDVTLGTLDLKLQAVSDSGENVEYFVFAGPAVVHDGNLLRLTEIPPRSKFPMKVTVVAWQFGRSAEPRIQTAEMVEQSFRIVK